tara:strand:- start:312 stop:3062 length:2751 start_codon:yes stop_codon:yes gene_type:complete
MTDVHPYPQNITADPFMVYGGLFSRKVVETELSKMNPSQPNLFTRILADAGRCRNELALQRALERTFNNNGIACTQINRDDPKCDRLLGSNFLVEIKVSSNDFDPQSWNGSEAGENAVEQTRGYLDESTNRKWALLTNGNVLRIMHKDASFRFLDIWICDTERHGATAQATFFEKLLNNPSYLEEVFEKSKSEVNRFSESFEENVVSFWEKYKKKSNRDWNVSLVETVLLVSLYRYLEDIGVMPLNSINYASFSMQNLCSEKKILECLESLQNQEFITRNRHFANGLIEDDTLTRVKKVLKKPKIVKDLQRLFWIEGESVDLSDLKVSFFGDAYQLFANKHDVNGAEGQYFTGSELARDSATFLVEEERRGLEEDEIIYDPFVGSGQLLRALVPFFHILVQDEDRSNSIINGMRLLASRFAGTDIDANACWLARLSLTIATAEKGKPFLDFSKQIKKADVFETCFGYTESRWQEKLGIEGTIKGIVTNPPWRRLRQTKNELYTIETGNPAPLKANKENWKNYQDWIKKGGAARAQKIGDELKALSIEHRETFKRSGQREVNLAISAVDFIDRIKGHNNKKWIAFLPDSFFIGSNKMRSAKDINIRKYYSYPYNDHFKDTDSVMKFGIVFGGGSKSRSLHCHPMGKGKVNVKNVFKKLGVLPIYENTAEAQAQASWFRKSKEIDLWRHGEFHEAEQPKKGAVEDKDGMAIRGAKKCNNKLTYRCDVNSESITKWKHFNPKISAKQSRVIVRDKRSNTRQMKILWAGLHIPGEAGLPNECYLTNAWNYLKCDKDNARYLFGLMNSPIADLAIRSIASKRNVNPKDLNKIGLPEVSAEVKDMVVATLNNYELCTSIILKIVFEMEDPAIEDLIGNCSWLSDNTKTRVLDYCSSDLSTVVSSFKDKKKKSKRKVSSKKAV